MNQEQINYIAQKIVERIGENDGEKESYGKENIINMKKELAIKTGNCPVQTHNFHIARHGKCQDCGGTDWMDAPAQAQGVEDWQQQYSDLLEWTIMLVGPLKELVELKQMKDEKGKTAEYEERQPKAWYMARTAVAMWEERGNYGLKLKHQTPQSTHAIGERWVEIADWTRNYLSKKYPTISEDDMEGDELRLYFTIIVDALTEYTAGSRWQQGQGELEALRRWKAEAIEVMPDMQAIGKALGLRIGESIHDKILPGIEIANKKTRILFVSQHSRKPNVIGRVFCLFGRHDWSGDNDNICQRCGKIALGLPRFENPPPPPPEKSTLSPLLGEAVAQEWKDDKYGKGTPWVVHFGDDQERFATEKEANEFLQKLKSAYIKKL